MQCATCDNSDLKYTAMLKAARHTDNFIDWSIVERAGSIFDLEQKLLEREQVDWLFSQASGCARVKFKSNSPELEFGGDSACGSAGEGSQIQIYIPLHIHLNPSVIEDYHRSLKRSDNSLRAA